MVSAGCCTVAYETLCLHGYHNILHPPDWHELIKERRALLAQDTQPRGTREQPDHHRHRLPPLTWKAVEYLIRTLRTPSEGTHGVCLSFLLE